MGKLRFRKPKNANEYLGIPPIGIILAFSKDVRPAQIYGGDWERCGQGKVIVGVNENDSDFIAPTVVEDNGNITSVTEKTGGNKNHNHLLNNGYAKNAPGWINETNMIAYNLKIVDSYVVNTNTTGSYFPDPTANSFRSSNYYGSALGGNTDNESNLQPYMTAYFWRRIA